MTFREGTIAAQELGHSGYISMMMVPVEGLGRVSLVHWYDAKRRWGVELRLDSMNRIISIVNAVDKPRDFKDAEVILSSIGIGHMRGPPATRPVVPEGVLRLRKLFTIAVSGMNEDQVCDVCGDFENEDDIEYNGKGCLRTCSVCLRTTHDKCSADVLAKVFVIHLYIYIYT